MVCEFKPRCPRWNECITNTHLHTLYDIFFILYKITLQASHNILHTHILRHSKLVILTVWLVWRKTDITMVSALVLLLLDEMQNQTMMIFANIFIYDYSSECWRFQPWGYHKHGREYRTMWYFIKGSILYPMFIGLYRYTVFVMILCIYTLYNLVLRNVQCLCKRCT